MAGWTLQPRGEFDTAAELPTSAPGLASGWLAYAKDTGKLYLWHAGAWQEVAGSGGGPHTHPISDITNLQAALDAKQASNQKGQANGYAGLDANGLVPAAQLPASSDPWTYLRLTNDFNTTSATAVDVTGLGFTPAANARYEVEARLLVRTASATVNPRPGWAWPTGLVDGAMEIHLAQTVGGGVLFAFNNISAALLIAVGGLPNATQSWPANYRGLFIAGASPSGSARVQLASETAGTTVTVKAGSFLKYRTVP